jgi:hypothetical protein
MSVPHLEKMVKVKHVCRVDSKVVFKETRLQNVCAQSPASIVTGCTGRRFIPGTLALSTRIADPLPRHARGSSKPPNDVYMCEYHCPKDLHSGDGMSSEIHLYTWKAMPVSKEHVLPE